MNHHSQPFFHQLLEENALNDKRKASMKFVELNVKLFYNYEVEYHSSRSVYFIDPNNYKLEISEYIGGGINKPRKR